MSEKDSHQVWNAEQYNKEAGFVSALGIGVIDLLAPQRGERILDLGCGEGTLALKLLEMGCEVVGVDSSPAFIAAAQAKGLNAQIGDGQHLSFNQEFDAVFSNAALHWMKEPDAVIYGVYKALKPNGRFVGELGGAGNVEHIVTALNQTLEEYGVNPKPLNPWYFPTAEDYAKKLTDGGFTVKSIALFQRSTPLPDDVTGWLNTFALNFIHAVPESQRSGFLGKVRDKLKPKIQDAYGQWNADYVRLRFYAVKTV